MTVQNQPEGRVGHGSSEVKLDVPKLKHIEQTLAIGDFTDNGDATGYADLTDQLPAGAIPQGWKAPVATGFSGDTTAVLQVGVAGDLDRFSSVTDQSVLATGKVGAGVPADSCDGIANAQTIRATITGGVDFGNIAAGQLTLNIYYIATE